MASGLGVYLGAELWYVIYSGKMMQHLQLFLQENVVVLQKYEEKIAELEVELHAMKQG